MRIVWVYGWQPQFLILSPQLFRSVFSANQFSDCVTVLQSCHEASHIMTGETVKTRAQIHRPPGPFARSAVSHRKATISILLRYVLRGGFSRIRHQPIVRAIFTDEGLIRKTSEALSGCENAGTARRCSYSLSSREVDIHTQSSRSRTMIKATRGAALATESQSLLWSGQFETCHYQLLLFP